MSLTYTRFAELPASEKTILCTFDAVQEAKIFTLHSGSVYSRQVNHYVVAVKQGSTSLTAGSSSSLSAGQWYYNPSSGTLYVRTTDSADPKGKFISIRYRFFVSDSAYILPADLSSSGDVEWECRVEGIGSLSHKLDDENTGIVLETTSSVNLINTDGFFDEIFDTMILENQQIEIYAWSPQIPLSEKKRIFKGFVSEKSFDPNRVTLRVKDEISKLQEPLPLETFSSSDGTIAESYLDTPKRRVFGRAHQMRCVPIDNVLEGYELSGTISGSLEGVIITGSGTQFLEELSPGDDVYFELDAETIKVSIDSVQSDTEATISSALDTTLMAKIGLVRPSIPYSNMNRRWHIAGHKLRSVTSTITAINDVNKIEVDSTLDLAPGDQVSINGITVRIRRISGMVLVLNQAIPEPNIGDLVVKSPVFNVFFGNKELIIDRDFSVTNTTEAIIEIDEDAEFNITEPRSVSTTFNFTNGSRTITTAAGVDLRTILRPRDWIRKNSITETTFYSVLDVSEQTITLREPFGGTTQSASAMVKNVKYIDDSSSVTCSCMGMEADGAWIKTASDAVKFMVTEDVGISTVNNASFSKADAECDYILSMVIPEDIGRDAPKAREVVTKINESVFGSLFLNIDYEVCYSILNSTKPETLDALKDDDILSFSVDSKNAIVNSVLVNYRPFVDIFRDADTFEVYTYNSDFVDRLIGIRKQDVRTVYLYEESAAKVMAQRYAFFHSLSNSRVKIKTKLQLSLHAVNDKIFLDLERLYKRYGGRDRRKIGIITAISKDGKDTEVEVIDLGNIFNRVPSIAPNTASAYASAERDEVLKWGYVLDNQSLTPNSATEDELGNYLIG
jgi:hypothetical protein